MLDIAVLVLNQSYEPINVCNVRRAFVLLFRGKAEALEYNHAVVRTVQQTYPCPSVIRLLYLIRRPWPKARLTRREVFLRDQYTCQYCGTKTRELTLDHVLPRHCGGSHSWENLVSACKACNHRKGGRTPREAHMSLIRQPRTPKGTSLYIFYEHVESYKEWERFLPELERVARH